MAIVMFIVMSATFKQQMAKIIADIGILKPYGEVIQCRFLQNYVLSLMLSTPILRSRLSVLGFANYNGDVKNWLTIVGNVQVSKKHLNI